VIADSVNPLFLTREAWVAIANGVPVTAIEIEVTCSDDALENIDPAWEREPPTSAD
jgi:hypothetical protein